MHEIVEFYTAALPGAAHTESRLLEEIAFLEARLNTLGTGDCAYEKSMCRTYQALLQARREQLSEMRVRAERARPAA